MKEVDSSNPDEFRREKIWAKNRLEQICVGDVQVQRTEENGVKLKKEGIRILGAIIEEQESLDTLLGVYIEGVSRSHLRDLFEYESSNRMQYRIEKLSDADLVEQKKASNLPEMPPGGEPPVYVVPTTLGVRVARELEVFPILTRDRDLEKVVDRLLAEIELLHETVLRISGKQAQLAKSLHEQGIEMPYLDHAGSIQDGLNTTDLERDPLSTPSRDNDEIIMEDMDAVERESVIDSLSNI